MLVIAGAMLFLIGSLSMLQAQQHDTMSLPGCALMLHAQGHDAHLCGMDALMHFTNLHSMFSVTAPLASTFMILSLIAGIFAAGIWFFVKHIFIALETSAYILLRLLAPQKNLRLQEAFSRGILHARVYEK